MAERTQEKRVSRRAFKDLIYEQCISSRIQDTDRQLDV